MKEQSYYNINDLGFAKINICLDGVTIFEYYTVLSSKKNRIIDLQYPNRKISVDKAKIGYSYAIETVEPIKNFERDKKALTVVDALKSLKQYVEGFNKNVIDDNEIVVIQK